MPPFEQLRAAVSERVQDGRLRPGDKMPTVRALAADLGLAPNTVAKAYRELEADGLLSTRGRAGTFIAADDARREAVRAARAYVATVNSLGLAPHEAVEVVEQLLRPGSTSPPPAGSEA